MATAGPPGTPRLLRTINDRAALELLLTHRTLTRTRLGELTGLSKPTASQLLARLEEAGLVRTCGTVEGSSGPSAQLYEVTADAGFAAGVDALPDRTSAEVVDLAGRVVGAADLPVPRRGRSRSSDPLVDVPGAVQAAAAAAGVPVASLSCVVVGVQGAHDAARDTLAYAAHLPRWTRRGVLAGITDALGRPVTLENDVNLAAVAERAHGLTEEPSFALLWLGEGLGLAVELAGALHRGATGGAGEVGYMPVPAPTSEPGSAAGPAVPLQDLVGGRAVLRLAREHGIRARTPQAAVHAAVEGGAENFLDVLAARVAIGLATIVAVLDPHLVVLSGAVGRAGGEPLRGKVERELHRISPLHPPVAVTAVPGNPVLAGAVSLALADCRERVFAQADPATAHDHPRKERA
jgi:predicted NBD/HSP70 family sugar kinase